MFLAITECNGLDSVVVIIKFILKIIQWVVPIVLILLGTIDLVKAVTKGKEEDIKKGQKVLITRAITSVIIFLVPLLVSIIMGWIGPREWKVCWNRVSGNISDVFNNGNSNQIP